MSKCFSPLIVILVLLRICASAGAQAIPATAGESLSGKRVAPADAVRGHWSLLIASFSKDAGSQCDEWAKLARADSALTGVAVYEEAMLGRAPGFIRGVIKSALRKDRSAAEKESFFVLTEDEPQWRSYFNVTAESDPYIVLLDPAGQIRWHGHGNAANLEPLLKVAYHPTGQR